ncbi:hypothetical protein [Streptomyces sp. NPDC059466]|uniref:hypothetical protein n=1 Tax=unclassified Streptomyces TaxID=2593676 RepID=UPI0036A6AB21
MLRGQAQPSRDLLLALVEACGQEPSAGARTTTPFFRFQDHDVLMMPISEIPQRRSSSQLVQEVNQLGNAGSGEQKDSPIACR